MRKIVMIVSLILVLGLMLVPVSVSAAGVSVVGKTGNGTWVGNTWEVDIYPGEEKSTTLTLYNSSAKLANVEITVIPESLDNGNLIFSLSPSSLVMPGGTSADVVLSVKASSGATPDTYTAELKIESEIVTPTPTPTIGPGPSPGPVVTPSPTPTITPTPTPTVSPTPTPTLTPTPTPTVTPTVTPTPTPTPTPVVPGVTPWWLAGLLLGVLAVVIGGVLFYLIVWKRKGHKESD